MRGIEGLEAMPEQVPLPALPAPLTPTPAPGLGRGEHAARRTLRRQIARLELRLSRAVVADLHAGARGRTQSDVDDGPAGGPRLLSLGDLELQRDGLLARLAEVDERRAEEEHNRALLREMYRDPGSHRFERLETADLAERGCRVYQVVPRFGVVGLLAGWWRVKVSSGCPLARRPRGDLPAGGVPAPSTGGPRVARPASRAVVSTCAGRSLLPTARTPVASHGLRRRRAVEGGAPAPWGRRTRTPRPRSGPTDAGASNPGA